ncbi:MAG: hypothetical protein OXI87_04930 [Albidovulum sp.]|nr:hypothetical protein [Albidovulum sp.]
MRRIRDGPGEVKESLALGAAKDLAMAEKQPGTKNERGDAATPSHLIPTEAGSGHGTGPRRS